MDSRITPDDIIELFEARQEELDFPSDVMHDWADRATEYMYDDDEASMAECIDETRPTMTDDDHLHEQPEAEL